MIFTEEHYKFGPLFKSCTDSSGNKFQFNASNPETV